MQRKAKAKEASVTVRFPKDVLSQAKASAQRNRRSQNAEIVHLVATGLGLGAGDLAKQAA